MNNDIRRLRAAAVFKTADGEQAASVPWPALRRVVGRRVEEDQEPTEQEFEEFFDSLWRARVVVQGSEQVTDQVQQTPEEIERNRARLLRLAELPAGWGLCQCTNCEQVVSPSDGKNCDFCFGDTGDCGCDCKGCTAVIGKDVDSQERSARGATAPVRQHD
jgi:hypothetical protein